MFEGIVSFLKRSKREQRIVIDPKKPIKRFTSRVMLVCFPSALLLLVLAAFGKLGPDLAVVSFGGVVFVTVMIMLPFLYDLQQISEYARKLSQNNDYDAEKIGVFEGTGEVGQILDAVNKIHRNWRTESKELQNRTLSNAAVIDSLPDPLMIYDNDGNVVNANYAARSIFSQPLRGVNISDFIRKRQIIDAAMDVFSDDPAGANETGFLNFIPSKHIHFNKNASHDAANRISEMNVRVEYLPGKIDGKSVAVMVFHDVSAIKTLERTQADFVANASHELRTPLSVIAGAIETVQGSAKNDPEARDKFMSLMSEQALRMDMLINDLLTLSKINFEKDDVLDGYVNIQHQVEKVVEDMHRRLDAKKMAVRLNLEDCSKVKVQGDAGEVYQVFENLISNAIKYGTEDTEIVITAGIVKNASNRSFDTGKVIENALSVSVHNLGQGIKKEDISRVKERFYRVDASRNSRIKGTGLGLSIVDRILTRHQGFLDIKSKYGKDATFTIFLPVAD